MGDGQEIRLEPRLRPTDPLPLVTSTHIEIRDVESTLSVSFNGMMQCTPVFTGRMLLARTDYTSVTCAACSMTKPKVKAIQLAVGSVHSVGFEVWAPLPQASTCKTCLQFH